MGLSISAATGEVTNDRPATITPAASWTHQSGDTEAKREHDFNNWLMELTLAAESGDSKVVAFVTDELRKMYRQANRKGE